MWRWLAPRPKPEKGKKIPPRPKAEAPCYLTGIIFKKRSGLKVENPFYILMADFGFGFSFSSVALSGDSAFRIF